MDETDFDPFGKRVRVFANGPRDLGSIARSSHTKDSKSGT